MNGPVGAPSACLLIDDMVLLRKGKAEVGVARWYCGALGRKAMFPSLVSLTPISSARRLRRRDGGVRRFSITSRPYSIERTGSSVPR